MRCRCLINYSGADKDVQSGMYRKVQQKKILNNQECTEKSNKRKRSNSHCSQKKFLATRATRRVYCFRLSSKQYLNSTVSVLRKFKSQKSYK